MNQYLTRIIELRKSKGLTQKQLADSLGIGQVSYSQIETGKTEITLHRLSQIAKVLNVDLFKLLFPDFNMAAELENLRAQNQLLRENNELLFEQLQDKKMLIEVLSQFYPEIRERLQIKADYDQYKLKNSILSSSNFGPNKTSDQSK